MARQKKIKKNHLKPIPQMRMKKEMKAVNKSKSFKMRKMSLKKNQSNTHSWKISTMLIEILFPSISSLKTLKIKFYPTRDKTSRFSLYVQALSTDVDKIHSTHYSKLHGSSNPVNCPI
jgi:hypothetical protein